MQVTLAAQSDPTFSPQNADPASLAGGLLVKPQPGVLYGAGGYKVTAEFIQLHDSVTLPTAGAVPKFTIPVPANQPWSIDFGVYGRGFNNGIAIVTSTTGPTYTAGANDAWISARYE